MLEARVGKLEEELKRTRVEQLAMRRVGKEEVEKSAA